MHAAAVHAAALLPGLQPHCECPAFLWPQICRIQNVSHLRELRVLNLAANNISRVENLQGLQGLRELHLQHNRLSGLVSGWGGTDSRLASTLTCQ